MARCPWRLIPLRISMKTYITKAPAGRHAWGKKWRDPKRDPKKQSATLHCPSSTNSMKTYIIKAPAGRHAWGENGVVTWTNRSSFFAGACLISLISERKSINYKRAQRWSRSGKMGSPIPGHPQNRESFPTGACLMPPILQIL